VRFEIVALMHGWGLGFSRNHHWFGFHLS
jgi:hypothetical protein